MDVQQLRSGLWRWTATHPDWSAKSDWPAEVGCVYYEAPDSIVLIDPLVPADEPEPFFDHLDRDVRRAGLPVAVLLTIYWHHRSARELAERYDARVWVHARDLTATLERVPAELVEQYELDDPLPGGIRAFDGDRKNEVVLWIEEHRALVPGDVLLGTDDGGVTVCPESWLEGQARDTVRASLRALLDLPVELLLLSHGAPIVEDAHAALERALS